MSGHLIDDKQQSSNGVNLLISMLVRYPEIGAITFETENNVLKLTFIISGFFPPEDYAFAKSTITDAIEAYHALIEMDAAVLNIEIASYDEISRLTILRDVPTLSCGEISLMIKLVNERFTNLLATEADDDLLNEDILRHDEVIENMLQNMRAQSELNKSLIGIRENGRVFVFNK